MYPVAVVLQYTIQLIQYNIILYNTQNNTHSKQNITQNYKHNAHKITDINFQPNTQSFNLTIKFYGIS
jgi:hypothetical protein